MAEEVALPTYETLLTEAIRSLAVDSGTVFVPPPAGVAVLQDDTKNWPVDVHRGRLVKIIRGAGVGQLRIILSNSDRLLTLNQAWIVPPDTGSVYVILGEDFAVALLNMNLRQWGGTALTGRDISAKGLGFSGAVYENENTATDDTVRRFEASSKKLRDVVIQVETNAQLFGNASNQRFKVTAGASMGFTQVDLSTLYFKNAGAGQNGTVRILGVED